MVSKFPMIRDYHQSLANRIASQLQIETPNHHLTSGTSRELVWLEIFENMIPTKFKVAQSVFLIDSFGNISAEVDIAVYDDQYTPYIFNRGNILYIPIEAVLVVVQSKSITLKKKVLREWTESITVLKPVLNAVSRIQGGILNTGTNSDKQTQTATRPIMILCTLNLFKENKTNAEIKRNFDFILHLDEIQKLQCLVCKDKTLAQWYEELNHYKLERYGPKSGKLKKLVAKSKETTKKLSDLCIKDDKGKKNVLLTFKMQLNQLIMLINNPMFFPHVSYVDLFKRELKKQVKKEGIKEMEKSKDHFLLAIYDITGIQEYIFASNRMKENAGASFIVGEMVKTHFVEILEDLGKGKAITKWDEKNQDVHILEKDNIPAEVVYIGGGNALVIYRDWSLYHKVNEKFALKVLEESASLTMATEAIPFQKDDGRTYDQLYQELMKKLAETKAKQIRTKLNQTLPIFAQESFKGNSITNKKDDVYLSTEQYLKRKVKRNRSILKKDDDRFVIETEALKRKVGEDSYIAVVHIDGNGIGEWINRELAPVEKDKVVAIKKHRQLSQEITKKFKEVFEKTIGIFIEEGKKFPMRPLIIDGDDVTFICQADLAIPFTQAFLANLEEDTSTTIRACAGVAFVHSHFPFELAYEIAEACCQNAKGFYYEHKVMKKSYFDFYLVRGGYVKTMAEQREQQSYLESKNYDVQELKELQTLIVKLNEKDESPEHRSWPRSRLIALYEAYLRSEEDVRLVKDEAASRGYQAIQADDRMLFDALQLIDFGKGEEWTNCLNTN